MLLYSEGNAAEILKSNPALDRSATAELVKRLFGQKVSLLDEDGNLSYTCPFDKEIIVLPLSRTRRPGSGRILPRQSVGAEPKVH
ncbi:hypothetical protein LP419_31375 [Massilia sp. H-1]|nr:hypothetical protein LP419_31375 [Massilia sp. H-1]